MDIKVSKSLSKIRVKPHKKYLVKIIITISMSQNMKEMVCWPSSNVFSVDSQTFLHCLKPL